MNKITLSLIILIILLLPFKAMALGTCIHMEDKKIIGISNESVFDVKADCTQNEIETDLKEIPTEIYQDKNITNLRIRKATIEEAIEILKKSKSKSEKTEDLIKLIDFLPTAMPLTVNIIEFQMSSDFEQLEFDFDYMRMLDLENIFYIKDVSIVIIDSENVIIDEVKNHKLIAIPNI